MRKPDGYFIGEQECRLKGDRLVSSEFHFNDGVRLWSVPKDYSSDGASIPWFCRWIPTLVALALVGWYEWNGYAAAIVGSLLQALIGWPLLAEFREAATLHDQGYELGLPKLECDLMFFRALRLRIWWKWRNGEIGEIRARMKEFRAFVMFAMVVLFGWPAYWAHAWRRRRAVQTSAQKRMSPS
jgi:hypothetical protein